MPSFSTGKSQTEFLSLNGHLAPLRSIEPPGCEGARSCLSFVLKTLAGGDSEVVQQEMRKARRMMQSNPEAIWAVLANAKQLSVSERSMVLVMQGLADHWIDSGKNASDRAVDTPSERNVEDIPKGHTLSLAQWIRSEFLNLHPRWQEMRRDGTIGFADYPPNFDSVFLDGTTLDESRKNFGRETAHYWFLRLLNSPYSRHIARCDKCRSFFAYQRARKRTAKNGVFCSECKGASSVERTQSTRERRTKEKVNAAATVWAQWKPKSSRGLRSKWIAAQVRKQSKQKIIFTGSWVTRHQTEIQAEVERRNYAKG